ncbi:MAG: hypothetical protein HY681_00375 [Chloroflexi bacterium]|nr:hypothetical protein [Chloroflexota bacterium]
MTVRFGKPLTFSSDASYLDATHDIEAAVAALGPITEQPRPASADGKGAIR